MSDDSSSGDGSASGRSAGGAAPAEFEAAQRALLAAVGLETRSRFVASPAGRIHVLEAGAADGDGDPPVVFVHGTAAFGAFLAPLVARIDDRRLVAFDRPGYGRSDPFVYAEATVRRTVVDALAAVVDATGAGRVDVVGHSMGGQTAVLFAREHPDRVRRLVLVGAVVGFPGTRPPLPIRLLTVPVFGRVLRRVQKPGEAGVLDVAETFGERESIRDHPAFVRAIAVHEDDPSTAAAGLSEFGALVSLRGWRPAVRLGLDELRAIQHPTRILWGDRDTLGGPDDVRDAVATIPDVRFETVDAGHIPFLAYPDRCAGLLRD